MAKRLRAWQVCDITFRCTTPGPDVEEGEIRGYWTGEVDCWGKRTIERVDGEPPVYLFPHEIEEVRGA